ncbi:DUF6509 family protein [Chryseomicrobium sp. FSL W7-1435]|uniref:DUF6509 family protein n=1 Tax=Chryseomicrobium sp. FSL W7-1435 TaxID=2921704 RepID=UPI0031599C79
MQIESFEVEQLQDPTGIVEGDRYEFLIGLAYDEEDELFEETESIDVRIIFADDAKGQRIVQAHFIDRATAKVLDFEFEEEELQLLQLFCQEHYKETDQ